jgi:hypothetical protein
LFGGILLIVVEVRDLKQLGTVKLLGPVAFVAGFRCGAHAFKRSGERLGISTKNRRKNLWNPRDLSFHIPRNPCTHVALHAGYPRMWAVQVGCMFGFHHRMADFSAKGIGVGEEVRIVAYEGKQNCQQAATS